MAFAKVNADPANRELVAAERAENQPSASPVEKSTRSKIGERVAAFAAPCVKQHRGLTHDEAVSGVLEPPRQDGGEEIWTSLDFDC
jgi:hypothetical protein